MTSWPIIVPGTSAFPTAPICRATSSTSLSMACDETGSLPQEMTMPWRNFLAVELLSAAVTLYDKLGGGEWALDGGEAEAAAGALTAAFDAVAGVAGVSDAGVIVVAVWAPHLFSAFPV